MDNLEGINTSEDATIVEIESGQGINTSEDATIVEIESDQGINTSEDETIVEMQTVQDECNEGVLLYLAAIKGDWKKASASIGQQNNIVRKPINSKSETALHIAVAAKHKGFVKKLLKKMVPDDLTLKTVDGNTALCFAAVSGDVEIAKMLTDMNSRLPDITGNNDMTPIYMAALFGHGEMVRYLVGRTKLKDLDNKDLRNLFLAIIAADIYDVALWMWGKMGNNEEVLNHYSNDNQETALHLMARKRSAISYKSQLNWFQNLANSNKMGTCAHHLVEKLCESAKRLTAGTRSDFLNLSSKLLFHAAEVGNVEFVVILIRSNPDIIWEADGKSRTLFHIAAKYRHRRIFDIIYELGGIKDTIVLNREEESKDNLLHLVARLPPPNRLQVVSGAAFQFQRELSWFNDIKYIVPRSYIKSVNAEGDTPHDLFTKEHENLRKEGEKWMKETATACMLVATLIATVVFAAAFTVPGGYDESTGKDEVTGRYEKTGFPRFRNKLLFDMFILSDTVSLLSAVTAIMFFLSILASRFSENDFMKCLPRKLMVGLLALFVSIVSMVFAFTLPVILIRYKEPTWSLIFIILLASLTAIFFPILHIHLWFDSLHPDYSILSKFLFQWRKSSIFL